ncbi:DUF2147 domain-containing protein [Falsigemmobacter faecalis]|uniref:DUF2147 domain-containing protein n=1 Tax=Falsigemmobacter faecalis TaxID=2488730 RepID=A0A3P3DQ68_9RHOB|nr:DUF2147 domain-containing protein [Falsigemmobacter faecalis]RRH76380.1 DUF2147 domain-containing protein [Falsigemmobacter faecalis]
MKAIRLAAALSLCATAAFASDPVAGLWRTQPDDGAWAEVQIAACGPALCGTIRRTHNAEGEYKSPNLGKQLVRGMQPKGNGRYEGEVWRPSNNKIYFGKMDVQGNSLKLSGCIAGGLICSSQTWTRMR